MSEIKSYGFETTLGWIDNDCLNELLLQKPLFFKNVHKDDAILNGILPLKVHSGWTQKVARQDSYPSNQVWMDTKNTCQDFEADLLRLH